MTAALGCTVLVDGVRLADGAAADDPADPTALDGLKVTWGRSTTLDQPSPASCSLTVADADGGARPFALLGVGRRLDVLTTALVYPGPTESTVTDPGFATTGPGSTTSNGTTTVGGGHATTRPADPTRRVRVVFPPAPYDDGTHPAAWDGIPRTSAAQQWRFGATVTLPPPPPLTAGAPAAVVRPVAFTRPLASSAQILPQSIPVVSGQPVAATFSPPPGVWLGLAVDFDPTGPTWAQLDPAVSWATLPAAPTWADLAPMLTDDLLVLAPAAGTERAALVFSGRITDVEAEYDDGRQLVLIEVTAQDHTAELANRDVASTPWAAEALGVRAQRIVTLSGQPTQLVVDAGISAVVVTARDVDAQPALRMLQDLAVTADAVLWSAVHLTTGQYLRLEDTAARPPLLELAMVGGQVEIVARTGVPGAHTLDSCLILLDPVKWTADVADVATRVAVRWLEQLGGTNTTEHTEVATDVSLAADLGIRRIGIGTELTTQAAAQALAARVLARTGSAAYRVRGLTWPTGLEPMLPDQVELAVQLLDGTTRNGAPILLTGLPDWAPVTPSLGLFLEGGQYTYSGAAWELAMTVSRATGQGTGGTWAELDPAWTWAQLNPTDTWLDLVGVAP